MGVFCWCVCCFFLSISVSDSLTVVIFIAIVPFCFFTLGEVVLVGCVCFSGVACLL